MLFKWFHLYRNGEKTTNDKIKVNERTAKIVNSDVKSVQSKLLPDAMTKKKSEKKMQRMQMVHR